MPSKENSDFFSMARELYFIQSKKKEEIMSLRLRHRKSHQIEGCVLVSLYKDDFTDLF